MTSIYCEVCPGGECPGAERCPSYKAAWYAARREKCPEVVWAQRSINSHTASGYTIILTKKELIEMYFATPRCRYCGTQMKHGDGCMCPESPTLDRTDNSETMTRYNTQIICMRCNRTKGDRSHAEFMLYMEEVIQRVQEESINRT